MNKRLTRSEVEDATDRARGGDAGGVAADLEIRRLACALLAMDTFADSLGLERGKSYRLVALEEAQKPAQESDFAAR